VLFDDSIAAMRLATSGLVERYPNVAWIVPHLGGTIPFVARRIDRTWSNQQRAGQLTARQAALPAPPTTYLRGIYYDVLTYDAEALRLAKKVLGADRLVYGSDFPYASRDNIGAGRERLREAGFTDAETALVLRDNIAGRLGLAASGVGTTG